MKQKNTEKDPMTCEEIDQMVDDGIRLATEQEASTVDPSQQNDINWGGDGYFCDWEDGDFVWSEDDDVLDEYYNYDPDFSFLFEMEDEFFYHDSYDQYIRESYWEQVYSKFSRLGQREQEGVKMKEKKKENKKAFLARRRDRQKEERKKDRRPSRGRRADEFVEPADILETIDPFW